MKNEVNKEHTIDLVAITTIREPDLYQVVIHNDDFTPMEFVMDILERFFFLNRRKAAEIMLEAHTKGSATFGSFSKDVAETKIQEVTEHANTHEHPLVLSMEAV